jgi:hypothetical protein
MEPIWIVIVVVMAAFAIGGAAYSQAATPQILSGALCAVADALGLPHPEPDGTVIQGFFDGVPVRIEGHLGSDDTPDWAGVEVTLARAPGLTARSEGMLPSFDFKTGDDDFDRQVKLGGEPSRLAGLLDATVRRLLVPAAQLRRFRIEERRVSGEVADLRGGPQAVVDAAVLLVELANRFRAQAEATEALLLNNVRDDPEPAVRFSCAGFLEGPGFAGADEQTALTGVLLDDPDLGLRLKGADRAPTDPRSWEIYRSARAATWAPHRIRAVEGLRRTGHPDATAALLELLPDNSAEVTAAVASALGELGGDGVEDRLLRMLRHPDTSVRVAAAEGLSGQGTIGAVERLLEVAGTVRSPAALRKAAREAIDAIQGRSAVGEAGGLALVETEDAAGRLSHATWGAGDLALVDDEG